MVKTLPRRRDTRWEASFFSLSSLHALPVNVHSYPTRHTMGEMGEKQQEPTYAT